MGATSTSETDSTKPFILIRGPNEFLDLFSLEICILSQREPCEPLRGLSNFNKVEFNKKKRLYGLRAACNEVWLRNTDNVSDIS